VISGDHLKVCPQGFSCCTLEMEEKLSQQSRTDLKAPVHQLSSNLQNTFTQRHNHFDRQYSSYESNQSECFVCHLKQVLQNCWFISSVVDPPPYTATVSLTDTPGCQTHSLYVHLSTCPSTSHSHLPHTHTHTHSLSLADRPHTHVEAWLPLCNAYVAVNFRLRD